ncbi:MAG: hypothetical protein HY927_01730 [Elusimicrobia bacterium]|nr:hypothetical protein [Elusimicrobiota bacterium]
MNRALAGMVGVLLFGGTAWALPPWQDAGDAMDAMKERQARFARSWDARHASLVAQGAEAPVAIDAIQQVLRDAAERLVRADRENPQTRRTDSQMRGNPYATAPGDNGEVDSREAQSTGQPLAVSLYGAAADFYGSVYLEGGGSDGFVEKVMPSFGVSLGEIRLFEQHLEQIMARLDGDGDRRLTGDDLSRLPAEIAAYCKDAFRGSAPSSARTSPMSWKKLEKVVREAHGVIAGLPGS